MTSCLIGRPGTWGTTPVSTRGVGVKLRLGSIQVLRNADGGGGGVSDFLEKSVTKV